MSSAENSTEAIEQPNNNGSASVPVEPADFNTRMLQQNQEILETLKRLSFNFDEFSTALLKKLDQACAAPAADNAAVGNNNGAAAAGAWSSRYRSIVGDVNIGGQSYLDAEIAKNIEAENAGDDDGASVSTKKRKRPDAVDEEQQDEDDEDDEDDDEEKESKQKRKKTIAPKKSGKPRGKSYKNPSDHGYKMVRKPKKPVDKESCYDFDTYTRWNLCEVLNTNEEPARFEFMFKNAKDEYQVLPAKDVAKVFGFPLEYEGRRYKLTPALAKKHGNRYTTRNGEKQHAIYPDDYYTKRIKGEIDESKAASSYLKIFDK